MAIETKTVVHGIWTQTETTYIGETMEESWELAASVFGKTPESIIRERVDQSIVAAKEVLKKAGYPIREGIYREDDNGQFYWAAEYHAKEEIVAWGRVAWTPWPFFLKALPLTIEYFAIDLIKKAQRFPLFVEEGKDNWNIALHSFQFAEAFWLFKIEHDGIALAAEKAIASQSGRKNLNKGRSKRASEKKGRTYNFALWYLTTTQNSNLKKPSILARSFFASLPKDSNGKAEMSISTISRYITELVSERKIDFPTLAV